MSSLRLEQHEPGISRATPMARPSLQPHSLALTSRLTLSYPAVLLAMSVLLPCATSAGQPPEPRPPVTQAADTPLADPTDQYFPAAAALKTDREQQRLLALAQQYVAQGRPDLAAVLWQELLDEAGDTLLIAKVGAATAPGSTPLVIYHSLAQQVEQTLAKLPGPVLAAYRTTADAQATALLAAAPADGEDAALAAVVRRYFLSTAGDDAALKLASRALDRHDFTTASRLLNKILTSYPDSAIPKGELLVRLAVAAAHLHDRRTAEQSLAELKTVSGPRPADAVIELVADDVRRTLARGSTQTQSAAKDWQAAVGNSSRMGPMPSLSTDATSGALAEQWSYDFPLVASAPARGSNLISDAAGGSSLSKQASPSIPKAMWASDELIGLWRRAGWRPAGSLLMAGGRAYFKTAERLVCFPGQAPTTNPLWQAAWASPYQPDGLARQLLLLASGGGGSPQEASASRPKTPVEILLFGDRVQSSLAFAGDAIYCLEGQRAGGSDDDRSNPRTLPADPVPRRVRSNRLTAYQAATGKAVWTRGPAGDDPQTAADGGFLAAPATYGSLLIAPVTSGGTLWLVGLDRATGKTIWRTYLCEEPPSGASPWAEAVVAVDGQDAYLTAGCGVVFAVEAASGAVRWAVRYARDSRPAAAAKDQLDDNAGLFAMSGWDDDVVIPSGHLLVVLPSDSDRLLALDRQSGERVWESPRISPQGSIANYCLGVYGNGLYVAGKNVVRCYDVPSGKLKHETALDDSFGRGCLTDSAVYLPMDRSILEFDLELRPVGSAAVVLSSDEPVGNLFSDGERLWAIGAGRVYALTSLERRLEQLAERIAAGDADALLQRLRIHMQQNQRELALADLQSTYALYQRQLAPRAAAERLLAAMSDLKLPQTEPLVSLGLLSDLLTRPPAPRLSTQGQAPLARALVASITALRQQKPPGTVAAIVSAAPLFEEDYLLNAASFAMDVAATADDFPRLMEALESHVPAAQLVALRAAVRLAPEATRPALLLMLKSSDDRVRLAAARALANLGERDDILETLVRLLHSQNVAVRTRSQMTLEALTGQHIPFAPEGSSGDRAATAQAWRQWIAVHGATARLAMPLADRAAALGRTLLVSPSHLIELDADHRERWRTPLAGAAWGCQGLPNGHRLVAIHAHSMVIEYDDSGQEVWRKDRLPAPPTTVERLENGHTLVACGHAEQIVEIAPGGMTLSISVPGHPISAQRLDSGNTLVALQQGRRVVEVDRTGQVVWEAATGSQSPMHAVRLANGNTLVTLSPARQVVELDPAGQTVIWRTETPLMNPSAAHRLASGETLVADHAGVRAIDASGRQVLWQFRTPQVQGLSSF